MAALIWSWSNANRLVSNANNGLFSPSYDGRDDVLAFERALHQQSWMMTVALGVNVSVVALMWRRTVELPRSDFAPAVRDRRRDCMVACMRHLAAQSRELHRPTASEFDHK